MEGEREKQLHPETDSMVSCDYCSVEQRTTMMNTMIKVVVKVALNFNIGLRSV